MNALQHEVTSTPHQPQTFIMPEQWMQQYNLPQVMWTESGLPHLLLGLDNNHLMPQMLATYGKISLFRSVITGRYLLRGCSDQPVDQAFCPSLQIFRNELGNIRQLNMEDKHWVEEEAGDFCINCNPKESLIKQQEQLKLKNFRDKLSWTTTTERKVQFEFDPILDDEKLSKLQTNEEKSLLLAKKLEGRMKKDPKSLDLLNSVLQKNIKDGVFTFPSDLPEHEKQKPGQQFSSWVKQLLPHQVVYLHH